VIAGDSVDLEVLQTSAADSGGGGDVLPGVQDVRRVARVITRGWCHSFGYESTLTAIQTRLHEVSDRVCYFLI
jgi:hypothetical protein